MQVIASFGVDPPVPRAGRGRLWSGLTAIAMAVLLPLSAAAQSSSSAVLEEMREVLRSRWEFQKRHPLAGKAFSKSLSDAEREALRSQLRALPVTPRDPSAAGRAPSGGAGRPPLDDVWREFALGLCAESAQPGSGEAELSAAAQRALGDIPVNYELARILQGAGMFQRALALQKETQRAMLEKGYARLPDLAKAELWRARRALGEGRYQAARHSLDFTARLDPFAPWVPLLALELHLRERPFWTWNLGEVWGHASAAALQVRHYDTLSLFLLNLSRTLRMGLGIFGCLCVALLFARHFLRVAHPFAERLPHAVDLKVRYAAIALVPLSLAVGGAGSAALCLLAAAFLWRHASAQERAVLKAVLTGLAVLPILLLWEQSMGRHLDPDKGIHLYHRAYERGMEPALAARIASAVPANGEDSLYKALAGSLLFKKQGNLLRASEKSREALRLAGQDRMAYNLAIVNSGNLSLLSYEYDKAANTYSSARMGDPGMVEAWFNGSQAELYRNNSGKHKQLLDRAADLDPERVTSFLKDNDELFPSAPPQRRAMDPMLGAGQAWRAAAAGILAFGFLDLPVRVGIAEVPAAWLILAVAALFLGLFLRYRNWSQRVHGRDLFECRICNRVMCRTCRKGVHCQSCFKAVAGVHDGRLRGDLVTSLRNRARNREARAGRALDLLFPGAGGFYLGERSGNLAWSLAASLAFGVFFSVRGLVMEYPGFALGLAAWASAAPLAAVYALHHASLLRSRRVRAFQPSAAAVQEREAVA